MPPPPVPASARLGLALSLALSLLLTPRHGLWVDECFSLAMAAGHSLEHDPAAPAQAGDWTDSRAANAGQWSRWTQVGTADPIRIAEALRRSDTSPPLYYWALSLWLKGAGASDMALRGFSLLFALGSWLLLLRVAWGRLGAPVWGGALALLALAPAALWFGTEGRMYAFAGFGLALAAHASERAEARRWQGPWAWAFALGGAWAAWSHYFFLPAFLGLALGTAALSRHRARIASWAALAALSLLPWLLSAGTQASAWRVTQGWLDGRPGLGELALSPWANAWTLLRGLGRWSSPNAPWATPAGFVVLGVGILAFGALLRRGPRRLLPLWGWSAAALAAAPVFDLVMGTQSSGVPRYAYAALAPLCLLLGAGLAKLGPRWGAAACALLLGAWAWEARQTWAQEGRLDNPLRAAAQALGPLPGDSGVIVQSIPSGALGLCRYLPPSTPVLATNGRLSPDPGPAIRAFIAGRSSVALVITHELDHGTPALSALQALGRLQQEKRVHSIRLYYFTPPKGLSRFPSQ